MALDGIVIRNIASELSEVLSGARVDRIYQPERDELTIIFPNARLTVSASASNARVNIDSTKKENPQQAPMFCMLLRKHLLPSRVRSVCQVDFERIIRIDFDALTEMGDTTIKSLIIELMGRHSNIILIDENNRILDSIKHIDITVSSVRQILPGLTYDGAPTQNKLNPLTSKVIEAMTALDNISSDFSADKALLETFCGLSPMACREIVFRTSGDCDTRLSQIDKDSLILTAYRFFDDIRNERFSPCIISTAEKKIDFCSFEPMQYGDEVTITKYDSISRAIEEFYAGRDTAERHKQKTAALSKLVSNLIAHTSKKINIYTKTAEDASEKEKFKLRGDLLMANLYKLQGGEKSVTVENFYSDDLSEITITLDPQKTPSQNAQKLYSKYNKLKTAGIVAEEMLKSSKAELEYLESVQQFLTEVSSVSELAEIRQELVEQGYIAKHGGKKAQKMQKAKPLQMQSTDGFTILVGKNNIQNDYVTFKASRSQDIWLHTKNIPGSHTVIVKGGAEKIPDSTILEAANICAAHSKAKNGVKVAVDYTEIRNVKKIAGAKPGMVIYDNYNTVYVTPSKE